VLCECAIKVSANYDWIMCKFFEVFTEFAAECSLLGNIFRGVDVSNNKRIVFKRCFQEKKSAVFVRNEFYYLDIHGRVN